MKFYLGLTAAALGACSIAAIGTTSAPAFACSDPEECEDTRTSAERAADAAEIRRLNIEQARYVRQRDARYREQNRAWNEAPARRAQYERDMDRYERGRDEYERGRDDYEAEMAEWRRAVRLCRDGYYEYCR